MRPDAHDQRCAGGFLTERGRGLHSDAGTCGGYDVAPAEQLYAWLLCAGYRG